MENPTELQKEIEGFVAALARLFAHRGASTEVAVLALGKTRCEVTGYDNWDGGTDIHTISIELPPPLYAQISDRIEKIEQSLQEAAGQLLKRYSRSWLQGFVITPEFATDASWRNRAKQWLDGKGVTNQGRVRSDNVAPYVVDGLLFRSIPEVNLYQALKTLGISFAPLPVFLRGGGSYRRVEPDFVVFHSGILLVIEIDGQPFHQESPADAHARLTLLQHEGARVERIHAKDCDTSAKALDVARRLVQVIDKHAAQR